MGYEDSHYRTGRRRLWLGLRAVLFGLLLAFPTLLESFYYETPSGLAFNDGDESVYLALPHAIASAKPANSFYSELDSERSYLELLSELPSAPLDLALGVIARMLGLTPAEFGALLDFVVTAFSYFLFAHFFCFHCSSKVLAETASAMLLGAPWLLSPYHLTFIDYSQFESFYSPLVFSHTAVATLRGIHTQISYPLFASTLFFLACFARGTRDRGTSVALGCLLGLLSYTYVFAWLSALSIVGFTFLLLLVLERRNERDFGATFRAMLLVILLQMCLAAPSLFLASRASELFSNSGFATPLLSEVGYFSFEIAGVFLIAILLCKLLETGSPEAKLTLLLIAATSAAEFPLMNLQAFTGRFIVPVHFPVFFLHPLLGSLIFCLVVQQLYQFKNLKKAVLGLSLSVFLLIVVGNARKVLAHEERRDSEFVELVSFVQENVPREDVLAWLPYFEPFTENATPWKIRGGGNYLYALTGIHLLFQYWQENVLLSAKDSFSRELLTAWIFSGQVQTVGYCNTEINILSKDMYFQHWISAQNRRRKICEETKEYRQKVDACSLLAELRVDYALLETDLGLSPSRPLEQYGKRVWQSSEGKYTLYRFDRELAMRTECEQKEG